MGLRGRRAPATGSLERPWGRYFALVNQREPETFTKLITSRSEREISQTVGQSKVWVGGMSLNVCVYAKQFLEARDSKRFPKGTQAQIVFLARSLAYVQAGLSPRTIHSRPSAVAEPECTVVLGLELKARVSPYKLQQPLFGFTGSWSELERLGKFSEALQSASLSLAKVISKIPSQEYDLPGLEKVFNEFINKNLTRPVRQMK